MLEPIEPRNILGSYLPSSYNEHMVRQGFSVEETERLEEVLLYSRQEGIGRAIEQLYWRSVRPKGSMRNKLLHGIGVACDEVRLLHVEVIEEMPDAIGAVQWATDDMIETEPRLSIFHDVSECGWKTAWCGAEIANQIGAAHSLAVLE